MLPIYHDIKAPSPPVMSNDDWFWYGSEEYWVVPTPPPQNRAFPTEDGSIPTISHPNPSLAPLRMRKHE